MDIMKESTLQSISEELQMQNALLAAIANAEPGSIKIENFAMVQELVQTGLASKIFAIGDQFICPWTDTVANKTYDWVWDVVHFGDVTLEDGNVVPGMYLKSHYTTPFGIQFDNVESEKATESTFLADYSYYTKNPDGSFKLEEVTVGQTIPLETEYFHSAIKDPTGNICKFGYNRWSHSAIRQWLNSDKDKGAWWTAQHLGDVAPNELKSRAGFLTGFQQDFLSVIKKVKIRTQLNSITDKDIGTDEETIDLMFLPSKEQMYGTTENGIYNDEPFTYYKIATGFDKPKNDVCQGRVHYKIDVKTSPQIGRLRSPNRGNSYNTWYANTTGNLNNNNANNSNVCSPDCVKARTSNPHRRKGVHIRKEYVTGSTIC